MFVAKEPEGSWTMDADAGLVIYSGLFILSHNNTVKSADFLLPTEQREYLVKCYISYVLNGTTCNCGTLRASIRRMFVLEC